MASIAAFANIRRDGFAKAAADRGVEVQELSWHGQTPMPKKQGRVGWLAGQLKELERPVGVMAVNDVVAADILDAAEHAGLRVPEEIAVVGADNDPILAELGVVPLTSVEVAHERVGYEAAALLDRMLNGERPPSRPVLVRRGRGSAAVDGGARRRR